MHKKKLLCPTRKVFACKRNPHCQTKAVTKKATTANLGMNLKVATEKANSQPSTNRLQLKTKTTALRHKIKTARQKTYEPVATEKG